MSNFDENVVTKLKRLEREIERLKVGSEKANPDGWIPVSATWTYASATTITVPSGAAAIYKVGQGIKLNNTDTKYFYIVGVADTVLTITGGSDYTLDSDAISAISYTNTPHTAIGFPVWFNWTPVWMLNDGTLTTTYTTQTGRFSLSGRKVTATYELVLNVISVATANKPFYVTPPINLVNTGADLAIGTTIYRDSGTEFIQAFAIGFVADQIRFMACLASMVDFLGASPAKTLATGDSLMGTVTYEI